MEEEALLGDLRQYIDDQIKAKRDPETINKLVAEYIALKN